MLPSTSQRVEWHNHFYGVVSDAAYLDMYVLQAYRGPQMFATREAFVDAAVKEAFGRVLTNFRSRASAPRSAQALALLEPFEHAKPAEQREMLTHALAAHNLRDGHDPFSAAPPDAPLGVRRAVGRGEDMTWGEHGVPLWGPEDEVLLDDASVEAPTVARSAAATGPRRGSDRAR